MSTSCVGEHHRANCTCMLQANCMHASWGHWARQGCASDKPLQLFMHRGLWANCAHRQPGMELSRHAALAADKSKSKLTADKSQSLRQNWVLHRRNAWRHRPSMVVAVLISIENHFACGPLSTAIWLFSTSELYQFCHAQPPTESRTPVLLTVLPHHQLYCVAEPPYSPTQALDMQHAQSTAFWPSAEVAWLGACCLLSAAWLAQLGSI